MNGTISRTALRRERPRRRGGSDHGAEVGAIAEAGVITAPMTAESGGIEARISLPPLPRGDPSDGNGRAGQRVANPSLGEV